MPTKAKQKKYNILMAIAILVIIVCGVMAVGHLKGWFSHPADTNSPEAAMICSGTTGVVQVERSGVGYTLKKDTVMQDGDAAEAKNGSEAIFKWEGSNDILAINENTEIKIEKSSGEDKSFALLDGELFGDMTEETAGFNVSFGENSASASGAVISVSERAGAGTLCVYKGGADVLAEDGNTYSVASGEQILVITDTNGETKAEITKMTPDGLSAYMINKLLSVASSGLCFTGEELNAVTEARLQEKADAAKALEKEAIKLIEDKDKASSDEGESTDIYDEDEGEGSSDSDGDSGSNGGNSGSASSDEDVLTCTIMIRCDSILDHMEDLAEGKDRYVPENGIILYSTAVEFLKGETAYDVTKRACNAMGIQIEASYAPLYGSYYVEGIGNLYEFDCGGMSGWLYKVNGWTPNYGCSEYVLEDGDSIVWDYTCTGN